MFNPTSFDLSLVDGVVTITLNRPDRLNALTFEVYQELAETFEKLEQPEVRAIVITGAGRGFCSGGDVEGIRGGEEIRTAHPRIVAHPYHPVNARGPFAAPDLPPNSTLFPTPGTRLPPVPRRYAIRSSRTRPPYGGPVALCSPFRIFDAMLNSRRCIATSGVLHTSGTETRPPQTPVAAGHARKVARSPSESAAVHSRFARRSATSSAGSSRGRGTTAFRNAEFPASTPR